MQYHPKLKKAMSEINDILKAHDIAGLIILHTPGFAEHRMALDPSYSVAKWAGDELRVKATLQDAYYQGDISAWTEDVSNTVNMLQMIANIAAGHSLNLFELIDEIKKKLIIENRDGGLSSHTSQNN